MPKSLIQGILGRAAKVFKNPYEKIGLSWWQVKQIKHQAVGPERSVQFAGNSLYYTSPAELIHGIDEIFLERIYDQTLPSKAFIIDCGSNIGLSLIRLKQLSPSCQIIAFEPDPTNYNLLKRNIAERSYRYIDVRQQAVWVENGTINFEQTGTMSSKISEVVLAKTVPVSCVRLRDFIDRPVDFLKIDIEGAEFAVLQDCKDALHFVKNMFIEYHGTFEENHKLLELLQIIRGKGFTFYIKEATSVFSQPFLGKKDFPGNWDVQLNIFCRRA